MSFKTPEEAMEKDCIFRWLAKMFNPGVIDGEYEINIKCTGSACAQFALGRHRCGLV